MTGTRWSSATESLLIMSPSTPEYGASAAQPAADNEEEGREEDEEEGEGGGRGRGSCGAPAPD